MLSHVSVNEVTHLFIVTSALDTNSITESYKHSVVIFKQMFYYLFTVLALQKRWSNLRTSFIRDMKKKHDLGSQDDVRKYRYFNHMYFLLGTGISPESYGFENIPKPSPGDWNDDEEDDVEQECEDEVEQVEYLEDEEFTPIKTEHLNQEESDEEFEPSPQPTPRKRHKKRESQVVYEEVMLDPLQYIRNQKTEVLDQDVNFCMSLAPMFKSMPQSKKLKVQIEILKIFDKVVDGAF